jgi:hypothetical protein
LLTERYTITHTLSQSFNFSQATRLRTMSSNNVGSFDQLLSDELHSERTLPLLSYFVQYRQSNKSATAIFHEVKSLVGTAARPIPDELPDESEPLAASLINLIDNGPGKSPHDKIPGSPTVSSHPKYLSGVFR